MKEIQDINKNCVGNRILIPRIIFLRILAFIYLIHFLSVYGQIQGLWGTDGILPANLFLSRIQTNLAGKNYYYFYPTLAWLFPLTTNVKIYSIENMLYIICLAGIIISLLILFKNKYFTSSFGFFLLWYISYNFMLLGQNFSKFPWDSLLSEVGFAAIIFAPVDFKYINYISDINNIAYYALKFILLKFMVSTGINLIGSQCPYWNSFTGLNFFFLGQPLLNNLSLLFHFNLKETFKKIISAFGYFTLLYLPIGYFLVWRRFSIYAGQITFLFNFFLFISGNYSYIPLLIIALNVLNFDDYFFRSIFSKNFLIKWNLDYLSLIIPEFIKDKKK